MTVRQQVISWGVVFALFVLILAGLRDILFPFVAGFAIAYFLDPACDRLERAGLSRIWSTTLVTAAFFVIFVLILSLLVPLLYAQLIQFLQNLPRYVSAIEARAAPLIELARGYVAAGEGVEQVKQFIESHLGDVAKFAVGFFAKFASGLEVTFSLLSLFVITPIVAFYLLRDWDHIVAKIDGWLPRAHADVIREQIKLVDETMAGFVRGQFSVCMILGLFYGIGLSFVGLDFGLIVGLATGIVSFVPYFGMLIGFVLGMGLALAQFDSITPILMVAGVFGVGQLIEGNFLTPKLVGDRVNLHAVWIIFALLAGGALFGFVGIMLAVPVAAVIGVLVRFAVGQYLASKMYLGPEEPPSDVPEEES